MTPREKRLKRRKDNNALSVAAGVKKPKLKSRKFYVRALDAEFSRQIRAEFPACVFCEKPTEHCFHFVTRARQSVRWDKRNAVGSCTGCNYRYEFDPHFAIQWYLKMYGEQPYAVLVQDGNKPAKFSRTDLASMLEAMKKEAA